MNLYYNTKQYNEALILGADLLRELKKINDQYVFGSIIFMFITSLKEYETVEIQAYDKLKHYNR